MRIVVMVLAAMFVVATGARADEMEDTFRNVNKHLYGQDGGAPTEQAPPAAPQDDPTAGEPVPAPTPAPAAEAPAGKSAYLGCYKDESRRDLKDKEWSDGKMTPTRCIDYCRDEGFPFAGVQYGSYCFCGNRYGKYGQIPEKNCKMACSGDTDLDCGGSWANAVYRVGAGGAAAPRAANFPRAAGGTPLGCYKDESRRDLKEKEWSDGKMTPDRCVSYCQEEGFRYAGVQYGSYCFCGNRYGKYGKIPDKNCKMACSGDSDLDCGGSWANFVYEIK